MRVNGLDLEVSEDCLSVKFAKKVWVKDAFFPLTVVKHKLLQLDDLGKNVTLELDLSSTYWVEAPVLLALLTLVCNFQRSIEVKVVLPDVDIGNSSYLENDRCKIVFLCFLQSSKFLGCLPKSVKFIQCRKQVSHSDIKNLLKQKHTDGFVKAHPFIDFNTHRISDFIVDGAVNAKKLGVFIEELIEMGSLSIRGKISNVNHHEIQRILLTANKVLFEGLANSIEHAHLEGYGKTTPHFSIYSRLRIPETLELQEGEYSISVQDEFRNLPVEPEEFRIGTHDAWLELFICDLGSGMKSQLGTWLHNQKAIQKKKKTKERSKLISRLQLIVNRISDEKKIHPDVLKSLFLILFRENVSRMAASVRELERSEQTGLQEIALVLDRAGVAIITDGVEAFGGMRFDSHADSKNIAEEKLKIHRESLTNTLYGRKELEKKNVRMYRECRKLCREWLGEFDTSKLALGNVMSVYLQPSESGVNENPHLRAPTKEMSNEILEEFIKQSSKYDSTESENSSKFDQLKIRRSLPNYLLFDLRFEQVAAFSETHRERLKTILDGKNDAIHIVVRLPRIAFKNDVTSWLFLKKIYARKVPQGKKIQLYFVDVNPLYAYWLVERIEIFSKSLLGISPIYSVSVLSTTLKMWGIRKVKRAKRVDLIDVEYDSPSSLETWRALINCLVEMDTQAFWKDYQNHTLQSVYSNDEIQWSKPSRSLHRKRRTDKNTDVLFGYLDFTEALLAPERYRTCQRAVFRMVNLVAHAHGIVPQVVATDDMLKRIESDTREFLKEVELNDSRHTMVLSSVVVTGGTHRRYQERWNVSITPVCIFFRKNLRESKNSIYALLDWTPPEELLRIPPKSKQRITGTPFVSLDGDKSIQVPNITWCSTDMSYEEHYVRSKSQTYADFIRLGVLQLGHFRRGKRHEFMNVDLGKALDFIRFSRDDAWLWLTNCLYNSERDVNKNIIIVYPNTKHADKVIQWFLTDFESHRPRNLSILPINFLRSRLIEPLIVNPAVDESLCSLYSSFFHSRTCIRIFDSGVVTGSTIRALKQKIQSVLRSSYFHHHTGHRILEKATEIETVALLERSGFPMYSELMAEYRAKHLRYWRWDVPDLGAEESCSICRASRELINTSNTSGYDSRFSAGWDTQLLDEASRWAEVSHSKDAVLDNYEIKSLRGCKPDLKNITFGNSGVNDYKVYVQSPLELVGLLVERSRLLHRADIALYKAEEFSHGCGEDYRPDLSIMILSSHILLFSGSLSFWEKYNYAYDLISVLMNYSYKLEKEHPEVFLEKIDRVGALALFSLDVEILELFAFDKDERLRKMFSEKRIVNILVRHFVLYLVKNFKSSLLVENGNNVEGVWSKNLDFLRGDPHPILNEMRKNLGTHRSHHGSRLQNLTNIRDDYQTHLGSSRTKQVIHLLNVLQHDVNLIRPIFSDEQIAELDSLLAEVSVVDRLDVGMVNSINRLVFDNRESIFPSVVRSMVSLFDIRDSRFRLDDTEFGVTKICEKIFSDVEKYHPKTIDVAWDELVQGDSGDISEDGFSGVIEREQSI